MCRSLKWGWDDCLGPEKDERIGVPEAYNHPTYRCSWQGKRLCCLLSCLASPWPLLLLPCIGPSIIWGYLSNGTSAHETNLPNALEVHYLPDSWATSRAVEGVVLWGDDTQRKEIALISIKHFPQQVTVGWLSDWHVTDRQEHTPLYLKKTYWNEQNYCLSKW